MGFSLTVYYNATYGSHVSQYTITYVNDSLQYGSVNYYPSSSNTSYSLSGLISVSITAYTSTGYRFSYFQPRIDNNPQPVSASNPYEYSANSGTLQIWAADEAVPVTTGYTLTISFYPDSIAGSHINHYYISYVLSNGTESTATYYPSANNRSYTLNYVATASITAYADTGYKFSYYRVRINGASAVNSTSNPYEYSANSGTLQIWAIEEENITTFKIVGSFNDPGISSYSAVDNTTYYEYSFPYSSTARTYSSLPKNTYTFGAVLNGSTTAAGETLQFKKWVYQIGSASATEQYNYNQSFNYDASQQSNADIWIQPETNYLDWVLKYHAAQIDTSYSVSIGKYQLHRYAITFSVAKQITFSATSTDASLTGYLSTGTGYDDSTGVPNSYLSSQTGIDISITYTVSANTTYYFYIRSYNGTTDAGATSVIIRSPKPALWNWNANQNRTNAYNAVTSHGATTAFLTSVWDDLCDKVNEVRIYAGGSWSNQYSSLANTKFSGSSNKTLTAAKFNSLWYNVESLSTTGISAVSTGDTVVGSYFTTLTSVLNTYINSLT